MGILIFWGIAATSYRGAHITVDLLWANVGPQIQRMIDVFATLVLLFVVTVQTYTLFDKVVGTYDDNVLTFDLRLPTWPLFAMAWIGDVSAVLSDRDPHLSAGVRSGGDGRAISKKSRRWSELAMSTGCGCDHRLRRAVCSDAAARSGRDGDGLGRRHRLWLHRRRRAGAEDGRPDLDAHGDRFQFRRGADVSVDGGVRHDLRHEPRAVSRRQRVPGPSARRARDRHHRSLRRLCCDLRLVGRDRGDLLEGRLSGNAPLQLSAIVLDRRHRGRRHARRS